MTKYDNKNINVNEVTNPTNVINLNISYPLSQIFKVNKVSINIIHFKYEQNFHKKK